MTTDWLGDPGKPDYIALHEDWQCLDGHIQRYRPSEIDRPDSTSTSGHPFVNCRNVTLRPHDTSGRVTAHLCGKPMALIAVIAHDLGKPGLDYCVRVNP